MIDPAEERIQESSLPPRPSLTEPLDEFPLHPTNYWLGIWGKAKDWAHQLDVPLLDRACEALAAPLWAQPVHLNESLASDLVQQGTRFQVPQGADLTDVPAEIHTWPVAVGRKNRWLELV